MPNNFPKRSEIFQGDLRDIRDTVARPSLDTLYQVHFSFGNWETWLGDSPGQRRTQGKGFQQKMSLLCTQAELPGTNFIETNVIGHHQGIQESFPNLRNFPPLNLVFYVDADHVVLEVLETWMTYINPIKTQQRSYNAFTRFSYPETYKEILHLSKFERDSFKEKRSDEIGTKVAEYEFVNVWPTNMTSMRLAYGDSNVLRCNVSFAYDRFFTSFTDKDGGVPIDTPLGVTDSNDIEIPQRSIPQYQINRNNLNASRNNRRNEVNALMDDTGMSRSNAQKISAGGFVETVIK